MYFELWLLGTALVFTFVGYTMGRNNGIELGVSKTLEMLHNQKYIKIYTRPDGDVVIEKAE